MTVYMHVAHTHTHMHIHGIDYTVTLCSVKWRYMYMYVYVRGEGCSSWYPACRMQAHTSQLASHVQNTYCTKYDQMSVAGLRLRLTSATTNVIPTAATIRRFCSMKSVRACSHPEGGRERGRERGEHRDFILCTCTVHVHTQSPPTNPTNEKTRPHISKGFRARWV